ncbi:MAG: DUF502 domain-containing protein [Simkaniaceae bacterium]|nr:DUF502 domain-containing protein [Simkaniaceae bacterium]
MGKIFMRGLLAIAPIIITIALVIWLFGFLEDTFRAPIQAIIGPKHYFPGLSIIVALVIIFIIGVIINNWVIQKLYALGERILKKIPLVKTLYASVCDIMSFFQVKGEHKKDKVVTIEVQGLRLLGLVTRENFDDLPPGIGNDDDIAVFLPFSYQIGGFTVMMPKSKVKVVDMSIEQGMRFVITAGAPGEQKH